MTETELLTKVINLLKKEKTLNQRFEPTIQEFERQLIQAKLDRYRLGVIGVTSSGKSTMINSILGEELLSMAVKPSSSQLVTCSKGDKKKATVYFDNKSPKVFSGKGFTSEIIKKYSDENYNQKNKEQVKQLELSTPDFALPEDVLLVDSPGLDAYELESHEKLTLLNLLPTIDFCIFLTTFKTNSDSKMKGYLNSIAEYNCPVIIVQNMLDSVRPSVDGKKSTIDVANEHKKRVEKIVEESKITNKQNVRIVQISSKLALEGRLENDTCKLKKSNYFKLIDVINETLNSIKPCIASKRIESIRKRIKEIISEAEHDISSDAKSSTPIKFEFDGMDEKIEADNRQVNIRIINIIDELKEQLKSIDDDKQKPILKNGFSSMFEEMLGTKSKKKQFKESDLKKITKNVSDNENKLLEEMKNYNYIISDYCRLLGIDERRIRVIDSFGYIAKPKIEKKTVTKHREKDSFGGKIARFFGNIFNTYWGYEEYDAEEYDEEATRKEVIEYLKNIIKRYSEVCNNWKRNTESIKEELLNQFYLRRKAFDARRMKIDDEKAMYSVINDLECLVSSIPTDYFPSEGHIRHSNTDMEIKLTSMKIDGKVLNLYKDAERSRLFMHKKITNLYGLDNNEKKVILSWDASCTSLFLKNWFDIEMPTEKIKNGIMPINNIFIVSNPTKEQLKIISNQNKKYNLKWIILFNAIQYGSAMNSLDSLKLSNILKKDDNLFLIVQDFEELRYGGGVKDALSNMTNICSKLNFNVNSLIGLNDNNPLFSLTAYQSQSTPCQTQADEIEMLSLLKKCFRFLLKPETEKTVVEIMQALSVTGD